MAERVGVELTVRGVAQWVSDFKKAAGANKELAQAVKDADRTLSSAARGGLHLVGGALSDLEKWAKRAGLAVGGTVATLGAIGVAQAGAMEKATAQTNAVLASTGGVAHVTASAVMLLANQVQRYSGIQNTTVQGAENLLLGYTNIRNEVGRGNDIFNQATAAAADLSIRLGRDLPQTALILGRALQDPLKGMMLLRRAGVMFTQQQQLQINTLAQSGNLLAAQKLILAQVEKQAGGAARAYGQTIPGAFARFKASGRDALGTIVKDAEQFAGIALAGPLGAATNWFQRIVDDRHGVPAYFRGVESRWSALQKSGFGNLRSARDWATAIDRVLGTNGALVPVLKRVVQAGEDLWRVLKAAWPTIRDVAMIVGGALLLGLDAVTGVMHFLAHHSGLVGPLLWTVVGAFVALEAAAGVVAAVKGVARFVQDVGAVRDVLSGKGGLGDLLGKGTAVMNVSADVVNVNGGVGAAAGGAGAASSEGGPSAAAGGLTAGAVAAAGAAGAAYWKGVLEPKAPPPSPIGQARRGGKVPQNTTTAGLEWLGHQTVSGLRHLFHLHDGGHVISPGEVVVQPDEEIISLPAGATVRPLEAGNGGGIGSGDLVIPLNIDGREITRVIVNGFRYQMGRR